VSSTSQLFGAKDRLPPCGFECPHCGFHHLLSDEAMQQPIQRLKTAETTIIRCPECEQQNEFRRTDLQIFA
jgi:transcription elongation factor Elf1